MWGKLTSHLGTGELLWILFGLVGQIMFTGRFVVQWIASERAKRSVVTRSFWLFSIMGSSILSVYAIYRRDPVFILGQLPGIFIYFRNLVIMRNQEKRETSTSDSASNLSPPAASVSGSTSTSYAPTASVSTSTSSVPAASASASPSLSPASAASGEAREEA